MVNLLAIIFLNNELQNIYLLHAHALLLEYLGRLQPCLPSLHATPHRPLKILHKSRTLFMMPQMATLEDNFSKQMYLSLPKRLQLSHELGLSEQQVKLWFQSTETSDE